MEIIRSNGEAKKIHCRFAGGFCTNNPRACTSGGAARTATARAEALGSHGGTTSDRRSGRVGTGLGQTPAAVGLTPRTDAAGPPGEGGPAPPGRHSSHLRTGAAPPPLALCAAFTARGFSPSGEGAFGQDGEARRGRPPDPPRGEARPRRPEVPAPPGARPRPPPASETGACAVRRGPWLRAVTSAPASAAGPRAVVGSRRREAAPRAAGRGLAGRGGGACGAARCSRVWAVLGRTAG